MQPETELQLATLGEESFRHGTAVLLQSVAAHTSAPAIRFHILDLNLTTATRAKLERTAQGYGGKMVLEFMDPDVSPLFRRIADLFLKQGHWKLRERCWFSKFSILDQLKSRHDHVLYVDSDIYCGLDLGEMRRVLGDHPVCAVHDGAAKGQGRSDEFARAGLDPTAPFFNAGLMGVDLRFWTSLRAEDQILQLAAKNIGGYDQGIFNVLFYQRWHDLGWDWNFQSPFRFGQFQELAKGRRINLHYLTNPKPWEVPVEDKNAYFFETLDKTAFRGERPNALYRKVHFWLRTLKYRAGKLRESMRKRGH